MGEGELGSVTAQKPVKPQLLWLCVFIPTKINLYNKSPIFHEDHYI